MELFEFIPGALAAGWMVVRIAILLKNGRDTARDNRAG